MPHTLFVSLSNSYRYESNKWKIQILTYFVKEREKWTLLHKNQFLVGTTFQANKLNTSWFFVKINRIIFESSAHGFVKRFKFKACALEELIFWKKNIFHTRRSVSSSLWNIKKVEFWGKQRGMRSLALRQFYILMKIFNLSILRATYFWKSK